MPSLQGCPGPFTPDSREDYWTFTATTETGVRLSDGKTETELIALAIAAITGSWSGDSCEAITASDWPTIGEVAASVVGGVWPDCADNNPPTASADVEATAARVRFAIPTTWIDPITGATVTFPGTYFKITYDIVEEPDGWDDTIDDPDYEPPEDNDPPEPIPQIPKPGRPSRSFYLEDQVKEWTGPGIPASSTSWIVDYATDSGYITIPPPTVPGRRYLANIRFVCRENWFMGELPQVMGDAVSIS
jgi:hypothetical protein